MRQLQEISQDRQDMVTILQLTSAFEGLASMKISQIKTQVLQAQNFFNELWQIYSQVRADSLFRFELQVKYHSSYPFLGSLLSIFSTNVDKPGDILVLNCSSFII